MLWLYLPTGYARQTASALAGLQCGQGISHLLTNFNEILYAASYCTPLLHWQIFSLAAKAKGQKAKYLKKTFRSILMKYKVIHKLKVPISRDFASELEVVPYIF